MGMVVQHNMSTMNANRNLGVTVGNLAKSTEKLSSGYRINRAGDDAAGLAISEKMRGQIRGLNQASANAEDGISLIQTAEGALQESQNIIQRMRELAVQATSDTNTDDDREQIQQEITQLTQEVDRIANTSEFNTKKLLDGSQAGSSSFHSGKASVEGTFTNGEVSAMFGSEEEEYFSALATAIDDVIRVEFTKDGAAIEENGFNVASLNGTKIEFGMDSDSGIGKVTIANAAYDGTNAAGEDTDLQILPAMDGEDPAPHEQPLTFTIKGANQIKAGDVITINLQKATLTEPQETGKEALRLQIGANGGQEVEVSIASMKAKDLGITQTSFTQKLADASDEDFEAVDRAEGEANNTSYVGSALDVTSQSAASLAIEAYDNAIQKVSSERAKLGAMQNRLEHTINNLDTSSENLQSAESRIRDVNMADEMTTYSKNNILQQAGQSMLAQANQSTQGVLSLLG